MQRFNGILRRQEKLGGQRSEMWQIVERRRAALEVELGLAQIVVCVAQGEEHALDDGGREQRANPNFPQP